MKVISLVMFLFLCVNTQAQSDLEKRTEAIVGLYEVFDKPFEGLSSKEVDRALDIYENISSSRKWYDKNVFVPKCMIMKKIKKSKVTGLAAEARCKLEAVRNNYDRVTK